MHVKMTNVGPTYSLVSMSNLALIVALHTCMSIKLNWPSRFSLVSPGVFIELLFPEIFGLDCCPPLLFSPHLGLVLGSEGAQSKVLLPVTQGTAIEGVVETTF